MLVQSVTLPLTTVVLRIDDGLLEVVFFKSLHLFELFAPFVKETDSLLFNHAKAILFHIAMLQKHHLHQLLEVVEAVDVVVIVVCTSLPKPIKPIWHLKDLLSHVFRVLFLKHFVLTFAPVPTL